MKTVVQTSGMKEFPMQDFDLRPFILILFNSNLELLADNNTTTSIGYKFTVSLLDY